MGTWDETCFVSNLPISEGDEVRYFLITENKLENQASGTCASTGYWFPRTIGMRGKYAGYGVVEHTGSNEYLNFILKSFQDDIACDSNQSHDMTISDLESLIHQNSLYVFDDRQEKLAIGAIMCHEQIHHDLVASCSNIKDVRPNLVNYVTMARPTKASKELSEVLTENSINIDSINSSMYKIYRLTTEHLVGSVYTCGQRSAGIIVLDYLDHLIANGKSPNDKIISDIVDDLINHLAFESCIERLRKLWGPTSGKGSQHIEIHLNEVLISSMSSVLDKIKNGVS